MRAAPIAFAALLMASSTARTEPPERRAQSVNDKGDTTELCCILCAGWSALAVLTCPPCTFCAQPFFWFVGATGGECFKGAGGCDPFDFDAPASCIELGYPAPAPAPAEPESDDDEEEVEPPDANDGGAIDVMFY